MFLLYTGTIKEKYTWGDKMRDTTVIGERIRLLRMQCNKTQRDICNDINIEQVTLSQYETSKRIPKLDILISIAEYFNVSLDYLVGLVDCIDIKQPIISASEEAYIGKYRKLNQFNKEIIIGETNKLIKEQASEEKNIRPTIKNKDVG